MDAIITIDEQHRVTFFNGAAERMFGLKAEEVLGQHMELLLPAESRLLHRGHLSDFAQHGTHAREVGRHRRVHGLRANGEKFPIEAAVSRVVVDGKQFFTAIVRDVSETLRFMEKLQESNQKLGELNATKDKFFNIIAHDLRSPFNTLLGFIELLEKNHARYDDLKRGQMIGHLRQSSNMALQLVEELLQWARSQTGRIDYSPQPYDLKNMAYDAIYSLRNTAKASGVLLSQSEESVWALADMPMVRTILRNLVSNAIRFTPRGGQVRVEHFANPEGMAQVEVVDTGVGIEQERLPKLFQIEKNLSTIDLQGNKGTGLGLILCAEFVSRHGGRVWAESELGKGSKFCFTLPLAQEFPLPDLEGAFDL